MQKLSFVAVLVSGICGVTCGALLIVQVWINLGSDHMVKEGGILLFTLYPLWLFGRLTGWLWARATWYFIKPEIRLRSTMVLIISMWILITLAFVRQLWMLSGSMNATITESSKWES